MEHVGVKTETTPIPTTTDTSLDLEAVKEHKQNVVNQLIIDITGEEAITPEDPKYKEKFEDHCKKTNDLIASLPSEKKEFADPHILTWFLANKNQIPEKEIDIIEQSLQSKQDTNGFVNPKNALDTLTEFMQQHPDIYAYAKKGEKLPDPNDTAYMLEKEKKTLLGNDSPEQKNTNDSVENPDTVKQKDSDQKISEKSSEIETMPCPKCGAPVKTTDTVCVHCNTNFAFRKSTKELIILACDTCGAPIKATDSECSHCHQALSIPDDLKPKQEIEAHQEQLLTPEKRMELNNLLASISEQLIILGEPGYLALATMAHEANDTPIGDELRISTLETLSRIPIGLRNVSLTNTPDLIAKKAALSKINELKSTIPTSVLKPDNTPFITNETSPLQKLMNESGVDPLIISDELSKGKPAHEIAASHLKDKSLLGVKLRENVGEKTMAIATNPMSAESIALMAQASKQENPEKPKENITSSEVDKIAHLYQIHQHDAHEYMFYAEIGVALFSFLVQQFTAADSSTRAGASATGH
jgi:hypothetical protein